MGGGACDPGGAWATAARTCCSRAGGGAALRRPPPVVPAAAPAPGPLAAGGGGSAAVGVTLAWARACGVTRTAACCTLPPLARPLAGTATAAEAFLSRPGSTTVLLLMLLITLRLTLATFTWRT
jgi:hypothetical protein